MTTSYNNTVFESIKNSLSKGNGDIGLWSKVMKFETGKTYTFRFVPNTKGGLSLFKYQTHGWNDPETGKYVSVLSRRTFGKDEEDPLASLCYRVKKGGKYTPEEQEFVSIVKWNEYTLANVYVVDDPSNPENNGTVKIFKFGRKLAKTINSAINGEDESEYGPRVFDLSPNGVNFKLKVEKQGPYQSFDNSRFTSPVDLKLSVEEIEKIHESIYDLTSLNKEYSVEEIREIILKNVRPKNSSSNFSVLEDDSHDDGLNYSSPEVEDDDLVEVSSKASISSKKSLDDDDIESLLAD